VTIYGYKLAALASFCDGYGCNRGGIRVCCPRNMAVDVVVGLQRGDEGKGRFVDMLAEEHDIVARFNGGANAGHTIVLDDDRVLKLHQVPSGIKYDHIENVIGRGTYVDPVRLVAEIEDIQDKGLEVSRRNLKICGGSHLILPRYISEDEIREAGAGKQGSTKSGIAQVAASKYMRTGIRTEIIKNDPDGLRELVLSGLAAQAIVREEVGLEPIEVERVTEEYVSAARKLGIFVTDATFYLNSRLSQGARILAEGAQAFWLDVDHGMAPFTTSSSTTSGGVSPGLGVPPQSIDQVIGIIKATQSHVGDGPFVTEIKPDEEPELLARLYGDQTAIDAEFGATTGRLRRLGHLDLPAIRRANMVNGTTSMALTKLDWLSRYGEKIPVCVAYERKGKILEISPDSARKLEQSVPIYEYLDGWEEDIQDVRVFEDLPENAQNYVDLLEEKSGVSITMIGVGPRKEQVIDRRAA
jgi:adenylosuccinate synthase